MDPITSSNTERKIARQVFDMALSREAASLLADYIARAAAAATQHAMWTVCRFLAERDGCMGRAYEFRYPELISRFVLLRALTASYRARRRIAAPRGDPVHVIRPLQCRATPRGLVR